jgi:hypothetical protein
MLSSPIQVSSRAHRLTFLVLLVCLVLLTGCNRARDKYFKALEKVGIEKRELLVSRVDGAREAQEDAQEQFQDALEQFQAVVGYDGGELEKVYKKLSSSYDKSQSRAEEVHDRIRKVENVARSLFEEWEHELSEYQDGDLRRASEGELRATRERYERLLVVMKEATKPMDPVLAKLNDQVLFLKHNLNAQALGSLQGTVKELELDVASLVQEMQASIAEADAFIAEMQLRNQAT